MAVFKNQSSYNMALQSRLQFDIYCVAEALYRTGCM